MQVRVDIFNMHTRCTADLKPGAAPEDHHISEVLIGPSALCPGPDVPSEGARDETNRTDTDAASDAVEFVFEREGGKRLRIPRDALMSASEYFEHMLGGHFAEAGKVRAYFCALL